MPLIATKMIVIKYILIGYPQYIFENKKLYRIDYKTKSISCKWQFRSKREIKVSEKDEVKGFWLVKNKKRYFCSLRKLKHRLKKIN